MSTATHPLKTARSPTQPDHLPARLSRPETNDFLCIKKNDLGVTLALLDDFQGDELYVRIGLLQKKVYRYLDFVDSGEVYERASIAAGRAIPPSTPVEIAIIAMHPLEGEAAQFLAHVKKIAADEKVELTFQVRPLTPDEIALRT